MKLTARKEKAYKVRADDKVVGVIYGRKIESTSVIVEHKDFLDHYRQYGKSMIFKARLGGKTHQVYIKDIQTDPLNRRNVVHFDLIKVSATDTITADIPVVLLHKERVEEKGLLVQLVAQSIHTEYAVTVNISKFEIDVGAMEKGDAVLIKDIDLAEGLKILDDPEKMIVNVSEPVYEDEPTEEDEEEFIEGEEDEETVEVEAIKQKGDREERESKE